MRTSYPCPSRILLTKTKVKLEVIGFHPAKFDSNLMNELVLEGGTKEVIKQLTKNYMRRLLPSEEKVAGHMNSQSALGGNDMDDFTAWSADFIEGKGRGLIFLLHGTPGVGKTYTAGKEKEFYVVLIPY